MTPPPRILDPDPDPLSWLNPNPIRIRNTGIIPWLWPHTVNANLSTRPPPKNKIIRFFNEKNRRSDYADHLVTIFENSIGNKRGQYYRRDK